MIGNLLSPYQVALETDTAPSMARENSSFLPGATAGLPSRQEAISWYAQTSGWYILPSEMYWGDAFGFCRVRGAFHTCACVHRR